ncbi:hypothetical protein Q9R20_04290 [Microbacterium sp. PRF11]|uniref:hypothetical protein n=1 Tax=Microbacterium sp. PRF11 TaxID=2962593 RepID=UPI0028829CF8|nr:hypothetical protein [Microbacterium sp. PRF11]MDT0116204.1 hypothetical protein [Microbacterium sp. PRF11]
MTSLDDALVAYIWKPGSSIPGKHPGAIADSAARGEVEAVIAELDAIRPDADAADLMPWADRKAREIAATHPDIGDAGTRALRDLLSWTWR